VPQGIALLLPTAFAVFAALILLLLLLLLSSWNWRANEQHALRWDRNACPAVRV
jgi:hypothetical protein